MMKIVNVLKLHEEVAAVCPIVGVTSDGQIMFADEAKSDQILAAQSVLETFQDVPAPEKPLPPDPKKAAVANILADGTVPQVVKDYFALL